MPQYQRHLTFIVLLLNLLTSPVAFASRWALVIGNAHYQHDKPLSNPIRDSQLLQKSLEQIEFNVTPVRPWPKTHDRSLTRL